jgi:outer membrane immunogenic protein
LCVRSDITESIKPVRASGLLGYRAYRDFFHGDQTGVIMLKTMLLSGVAVIGLTGLAGAADLYVKAPPPVYIPTWTGCYIGGHAGYGMTTSSSSYDVLGFDTEGTGSFGQSFDNRGFAGGGQGGCQLQTGTFLWGIEGDWTSFNNSSSRNITNSLGFPGEFTATQSVNQTVSYDSLWSVRGRFGGIFSDVYHLYVTAGIGGARANYTAAASFGEHELDCEGSGCSFGASRGFNLSTNPTGIVFGAGAEWKIWPQFVIGAEYLHYSLLSDTALPGRSGGIFSEATELNALVSPQVGDHFHTESVDVIRVRASYLFNFWR